MATSGDIYMRFVESIANLIAKAIHITIDGVVKWFPRKGHIIPRCLIVVEE
jgi:hypothetical protein